MKRTRLSVIGLIAAAGLALAGCGSASTAPASSARAGRRGHVPERRQEMRVCSRSPPRAPTGPSASTRTAPAHSPASTSRSPRPWPTSSGVKVDLPGDPVGRHLRRPGCRRLRRHRQPGLDQPERKAKYLFSDPYTVSPGVVVAKEDNDSINSLRRPQGQDHRPVADQQLVQAGQQSGANVEAVEGWAQAVALVQQGRVDATINDKLTYLDYARRPPTDSGLKIAAETPTRSQSAFAFRRDRQPGSRPSTRRWPTCAPTARSPKICEKYFGADVTQVALD